MAIQSGSGGLKYPLPSQAEISARQGGAAASAGGSAAAAAYAANRRYGLGRRELAQKAQQAAKDRQSKAQQSFYDRQHAKGAQIAAQEARIGLQKDHQTFQAGQSKLGIAAQHELAAERREHELALDTASGDRAKDLYIQKGLDSGEFELPNDELKKLEMDRMKAFSPNANPPLTERQKAEYDETFLPEQRRLKRQYVRTPATKQFNRNITYLNPAKQRMQHHPEPGTIMYDKRTGDPVKLPEEPKAPDPSKTIMHAGHLEDPKE